MPRPKKVTDLTKMSGSELKALADRVIDLMRKKEVEFVDSIREQAREAGVEISDLVSKLSAGAGRVARAATGAAPAPTNGRRKRRSNPMRGKKVKPWFAHNGQTWSGRGIPARFISEYVADGGRLTDILVDKSKASEAQGIEAKIKGRSGRGRKGKRAK